MRQVFIKTILAVALGTAPGLASAQNEMPRKKAPEQSEGQGGGQHRSEKGQGEGGSSKMEENGGEKQPMRQEGQPAKRPKPQSEENRSEEGGKQGQPNRNEEGGKQGQPTRNEEGGKQGQPARNEEGGKQGQPTGNEEGGKQGQPTRNEGEEHGAGTKERHAEKGHVSEQQRSELKRVFGEHHVQPAPGINFPVNIGVRVPREVHLYRLPPPIVEIIPGYEGYMYFELPDGRIAIVDPETLEIVLIIA